MKTIKNIEGYERVKIGPNIRKWRNVKDVKQKQLAALLKMSEAAISNIENDLTDLTLSQIEDISIALNIAVEDLFTDPGDKITSYGNSIADSKEQLLMDKELVYSLIGSLKQKDEEMRDMIIYMKLALEKMVGDSTGHSKSDVKKKTTIK